MLGKRFTKKLWTAEYLLENQEVRAGNLPECCVRCITIYKAADSVHYGWIAPKIFLPNTPEGTWRPKPVLALSDAKPHNESTPLYFLYCNTVWYTWKYMDELQYTYVRGVRYHTQNLSQTINDSFYVLRHWNMSLA